MNLNNGHFARGLRGNIDKIYTCPQGGRGWGMYEITPHKPGPYDNRFIQDGFLNVPPRFHYQNEEKNCSANEELFHIENF